MAKRTPKVSVDSEVVKLLPAQTDIETNSKINVSKAEMANILTVQIQENLIKEKEQIQLRANIAYKAFTDKERELKNTVEAKMRSAVGVNQNNRNYEYRATVYNLEAEKNHSYSRNVDYDRELAKGNKFRIVSSMSLHTEETIDGIKIKKSYEAYYEEYANVLNPFLDSLNAANRDLAEVNDRITKSKDTKYVNAQLNMGILASSKNGTQLVANIAKIAENLTNTTFAKKPEPALISNESI